MPWDHVSASQVDTFLSCNRKWWLDKIGTDGVRTESASQALGTEVHLNLENFFAGVSPLDHPLLTLNTWAADVKARPDVELLVEHEFNVPARLLGEEKDRTGFIDLVIVDHKNLTVEIWDHKTTKDWRYAKSADDLKVNPQGKFYVLVMFETYGPTYRYFFGHHQILTSKVEKERVVQIEFTPMMIALAGATQSMTIRAMVSAGSLDDGRDVPPSYSACFKYGRCQYYEKCKGTDPMPSLASIASATSVAPTRRLYPEEVYIDCIPLNRVDKVVNFAFWTRALEEEFKADTGKDAMTLKYAEGVIAIASKARDLLDAPQYLFIRTSDAAGMKYLDLVETHTSVVQSIR